MSPPGHSGGVYRGRNNRNKTIDKLLDAPYAKEEQGRHIEGAEKKQNKYFDFAGWKHHEVSTKDCRDCTTRAYGRNGAVRMKENVRCRCGESTTEIKQDEGNLSNNCLDIVSKYPEE